MNTMNSKIDKFTGRNSFGLWQIKMRALLKQQGIWKPLVKSDKSGAAGGPSEAELEAMEEKAHSTILLCLADDVITEVADEITAAGLWAKLESLYMTKSLTNKLLLKQRLFALRMQGGTSLRDHLDQLNTILLDLRNIDVKIEDEDAALILLVSLPHSYENFVESFVVGRETVTLEEVKSALFTRELRQKAATTESGGDSGAGLVVNSAKGKGPKKKKNSKGKETNPRNVCHYCKEPGHWKNKCPKNPKASNANIAQQDTKYDSEEDLALAAVDMPSPSDRWILDSGCSYHMCPNRDWFTSYESCDGGNVTMGNDAACKVVGRGSIKIKTLGGEIRTLMNVRHVPQLKKNLISLGVLDEGGFTFSGSDGELCVWKGSKVVLKSTKLGTLYVLQCTTLTGSANVASTSSEEMTKLWHRRLWHMGERGMQILSKMNLLCGHKVKNLEFCEHCVLGKQHRTKFGKGLHITKATLDYIHSDCWGPARVEGIGGFSYFVTFIDDFSRYCWLYCLKHKGEAFKTFVQWKVLVENQTGKKVKRLRTDNGLEFVNDEFNELCRDTGIVRHRTVRKTPQQNGVAERMNQTLLERVRCMLSNAGLTRKYWSEAVKTACYLINRGPHTGIDCKVPYEVWSGRSAEYSVLRVFGCMVYYHVNEGKLEPRAKKGCFLGYGDGVKGYRIWSPSERRVILSRDVTFDENTMFVSANKPAGDTNESTYEGSEQVVAPDPTPQVRTQGKDNEAPVSSPIVETSQRDVAVVDETADVESDHEETVVEGQK